MSAKSVTVHATLLIGVASLLFFLLTPGVIVTAPKLLTTDKSVALIYNEPEKATSLTAAVSHTVVFAVVLFGVLYGYTLALNKSGSSSLSVDSGLFY